MVTQSMVALGETVVRSSNLVEREAWSNSSWSEEREHQVVQSVVQSVSKWNEAPIGKQVE